jgi:hypothetical protein
MESPFMAMYILNKSVNKTAKCSVRVGLERRLMTELNVYLQDVTVDMCRDEPAMATLKLARWSDQQNQKQAHSGSLFEPGEPILIEVVFTNHTEEVMAGYIKDIVVEYDSDGQQSKFMTVVCQDQSLPLDMEPVQKMWGGNSPVNDHFIAAAILDKYGLTLTPDSGMGRSYASLKQNGTDFSFLQSRARANGYEFIFHGNSVYFGPMRLMADCQYDIAVQKGIASHCQYFSFQGTRPLGEEKFYWASSELNGFNFGHVLKIGNPVCFYGVGEQYSGAYYVDTVGHHFVRGNYYQRFNLLRPIENIELDNVTVGPFPRLPSLIYDVL